jgi:hypothetical protein
MGKRMLVDQLFASLLTPEVVDFSAGLGDSLLFGTGPYLRQQFGLGGVVNRNSSPYTYGGLTSLAALPFGGGFPAVGRGIAIVARNGTIVRGLTKHGIDRVVGGVAAGGGVRAGVRPAALLDALKNPKSIKSGVDELGRPFQVFSDTSARVVVNPSTGRVVSVNPLSAAGAH